MKPLLAVLGTVLLAQGAGEGCQPLNCPYPAEQELQNIRYTTFSSPPKTLDPAISYNSNEYALICQIYEPLLQYHHLKRPIELNPLLLTRIPKARYLDAQGRDLPEDAPEDRIARVVYECQLKAGVLYQNHPCFAKGADGQPLYTPVPPELLERVNSPEDFPEKGTRVLTSDDCLHTFRRLANPQIPCPIRETLSKYILGMEEYTKAVGKALENERSLRKKSQGASYNQALDEKRSPIRLDLQAFPFPGLERVDERTFRIVLKKRYPQILYWMAMPFSAPVPPEAEAFFRQPELMDLNITLSKFPVGTGPFYLQRAESNRVLVLARNPNFREETYPTEGEPGDEKQGLLRDAGKRLPILDKVVFTLEKEPTPSWNKFLQGYYDASGISSDSFERAVAITPEGSPDVAGELKRKGIHLEQGVDPSVHYMGFNMLDPLVGGLDEAHCKLRQAIGIAINTEESIQIFRNGRGIPGMGPIPPGIFGFEDGREAMNPHMYDWDEKTGKPRRKPLEEARRLLAEAGYPGGIGKDGKQLVIAFDNAMTEAADQPYKVWLIRRLESLGIHMEDRVTDYPRFQDKVHEGNFQMFTWGWNADYPDPENFMFLFYGPNARTKLHGENSANYNNPGFNALFKRMENLENGPERMGLMREMRSMLQHDAPWVDIFYPVTFTLFHGWSHNLKPHQIINNALKYSRVDAVDRARLRREWNRPRWMPVWAVVAGVLLLVVPAAFLSRKRQRETRA